MFRSFIFKSTFYYMDPESHQNRIRIGTDAEPESGSALQRTRIHTAALNPVLWSRTNTFWLEPEKSGSSGWPNLDPDPGLLSILKEKFKNNFTVEETILNKNFFFTSRTHGTARNFFVS